jgi:hypothetical protein
MGISQHVDVCKSGRRDYTVGGEKLPRLSPNVHDAALTEDSSEHGGRPVPSGGWPDSRNVRARVSPALTAQLPLGANQLRRMFLGPCTGPLVKTVGNSVSTQVARSGQQAAGRTRASLAGVSALLMLLVFSVSAAFAQTTVTASWDRNPDAQTAGYRLYYGTTSGSYQWSVDVGNQVSAPLSLTPGQYYFAVRGYTGAYEYGPSSSEVIFTVGQVGAPTAQITATLQNPTTALVTWQTTNAASVTINGATVPATGSAAVPISVTTVYTIVATSASGATATQSATVTIAAPTAPTAQITASLQNATTALVSWQTANAVSASINGVAVGLSGSTTVPVSATTTFTVTATSATGATATSSATVTVTAPTPPPPTTPPPTGAPNAPTNMGAAVRDERVTLAWRAPSGGPAVSTYLLNVGTTSGGTTIANAYAVGNVLNVTGDLPIGTYYARVRAANASGASAFSNEVQFRIGRSLIRPAGFRVTWYGTRAVLSWTAPATDGAIEDRPTAYVLEAGTRAGSADVATVTVGNVTTFSTDIPSGTYYVRVRATNAYGASDPTEDLVLVAPGAPAAPTYFMASGQGSTVDLRWTAPSGNATPTGYVIEAGSAPGLADLAVLPVGNVTKFSTTAPPGTYYVRIRAINARGAGMPSNEVVVRR